MAYEYLLRNGTIADPVDGEYVADLLIRDGLIAEIGSELVAVEAEVVEAAGHVLLPGSIDAHSHADSKVLDDDIQEALLRQGVTTVIVGQDGVSYVPGMSSYANEYFGPINGTLALAEFSVRALLEVYSGATRLGVGYLVPAGTVRQAVIGLADRPATQRELVHMQKMVSRGLAEGALGLSSGLDYVPGCFADAGELAALCSPVAEMGGLYVSHMRGYEEDSGVGFAEMLEIARLSGVRSHVSHFHASPSLVWELMDEAERRNEDFSFDAYPYSRGSTLLSMLIMGSSAAAAEIDRAVEQLSNTAVRTDIRRRWQLQWDRDQETEEAWATRLQIASAGSSGKMWAEGMSVAEAALEEGVRPLDWALDLLTGSRMAATTVVDIRSGRNDDEFARQYAHPGATVGSDGIYLGGAPHPRGWGCFARMYRRFVTERRDFRFSEMAMITSLRPAERFGLGDRGRLAPGYRADLAIVDPTNFRDAAWYDRPMAMAEGVSRVYVAGVEVLDSRGLSQELPGGPALPCGEPR